MYSECIPNVKINSHSNTNLEGFGNAFHFGKGVLTLDLQTQHTEIKYRTPATLHHVNFVHIQ